MNFRIENLWVLFGLLALAVPVILHLLRRRRFDVLDWGAMQFLPDHDTALRKRWLDDLLLMIMRMAIIAVIVVALATPVSTSAWLAPLADRQLRETVIVMDASYSMDMRVPGQDTPWQDAVRWMRDHADPLTSDRRAVVIAQQPPRLITATDLDSVMPRGNPDM